MIRTGSEIVNYIRPLNGTLFGVNSRLQFCADASKPRARPALATSFFAPDSQGQDYFIAVHVLGITLAVGASRNGVRICFSCVYRRSRHRLKRGQGSRSEARAI